MQGRCMRAARGCRSANGCADATALSRLPPRTWARSVHRQCDRGANALEQRGDRLGALLVASDAVDKRPTAGWLADQQDDPVALDPQPPDDRTDGAPRAISDPRDLDEGVAVALGINSSERGQRIILAPQERAYVIG